VDAVTACCGDVKQWLCDIAEDTTGTSLEYELLQCALECTCTSLDFIGPRRSMRVLRTCGLLLQM